MAARIANRRNAQVAAITKKTSSTAKGHMTRFYARVEAVLSWSKYEDGVQLPIRQPPSNQRSKRSRHRAAFVTY